MSTFTPAQQKKHRQEFIEECRQKAWNAACNADHISKNFDQLMAEYEKLKTKDAEHQETIKGLENAPDYHTKENREKRKALQESRNIIAKQMQYVLQNANEAHRTMQKLYGHVENNLALAEHAQTWEWKETSTALGVENLPDKEEVAAKEEQPAK